MFVIDDGLRSWEGRRTMEYRVRINSEQIDKGHKIFDKVIISKGRVRTGVRIFNIYKVIELLTCQSHRSVLWTRGWLGLYLLLLLQRLILL